jgi:hypothetical protein
MITVQELPEQPEPRTFLYCHHCGEQYSAYRGDYFLVAPDSVMQCCGEPMVLIHVRTVITEVRR